MTDLLSVCSSSLHRLRLPRLRCRGLVKLKEIPKLVIVPLIHQVLAVNVTEHVVVALDFHNMSHEVLKTIVVPFDHKSVNLRKVVAIVTGCCVAVARELRKDKVVVTVGDNLRYVDTFMESYLVVVTFDCH